MINENPKMTDKEKLQALKDLKGAPNINPDTFPLNCGVEDAGCVDRYDGAEYGYRLGAEAVFEWVDNILNHGEF